MDRFALKQEDIPEYLYRVDWTDSMTKFKPGVGFCAFDQNLFLQDLQLELFSISVTNHLVWRKVPSPFISLFPSEVHAINWAKKWKRIWASKGLSEQFEIVKINTAEMKACYMYHAKDLPKKGIKERERYRNEYLCLHVVPAAACGKPTSLNLLEGRVGGKKQPKATPPPPLPISQQPKTYPKSEIVLEFETLTNRKFDKYLEASVAVGKRNHSIMMEESEDLDEEYLV